MKNSMFNQRMLFGILLVLLSVFCYTVHFVIFRDTHHIFMFLVGDIAFVFIEVLLVTLIIHQLLNDREKRSVLKKLNMVIGAFFTRAGTELLSSFKSFDENNEKLATYLVIEQECSTEKFLQITQMLKKHDFEINITKGNLIDLKELLSSSSDFILRLLENSTLLEHESFTELLWAVLHLTEELNHRKDLQELTDADGNHLAGDLKRAYSLLMREWLSYMEHLKKEYPYLFSLAIRTNPFNPKACVEIE